MRDPFDKNDVQSLITCFSWRQTKQNTYSVFDKTLGNYLNDDTCIGQVKMVGGKFIAYEHDDGDGGFTLLGKFDFLTGAFSAIVAKHQQCID